MAAISVSISSLRDGGLLYAGRFDAYYLAVQEATNSHEFKRKSAVNEKWTKLTSTPDWKLYQ